jgi:SAM-dependent methyltransferase
MTFNSHAVTEDVEICPLCGSDKSQLLFWNYDRLYRFPEKFGTLICQECNLVRLSPRPTVTHISRHYPDDYGAYLTSRASINTISNHSLIGVRNFIRNSVMSSLGYNFGTLSNSQKFLRPLLTKLFFKNATYGYGDVFPYYVPNGNALEVGCGNGNYLSYLKHYGWNVTGVDLSPHAARVAKELFDIDVFIGQLEDAPFSEKSFDYIHLSHVVEHFFDPVKTMKKVYELLKPNGTVFIEVPNAESISAEISKEYWYGWDAPRHLFMFSPSTLSKMLSVAGLKVSKMKSVMWNSFSWASTYMREEENGEKLSIRPHVLPEERLKLTMQNVISQVKHKLRPNDGDLIQCWATRIEN